MSVTVRCSACTNANWPESRVVNDQAIPDGATVVPVTDPDGYRMEFESPTDAPEESQLEEQSCQSRTTDVSLVRLHAPAPIG